MRTNKFRTTSAALAFGEVVKGDLAQCERRREKQDAFLASIHLGWVKACEAAGCAQQDVARWRKHDAEFRDRWAEVDANTALTLERIVDEIASGEREATPTQLAALTLRLKALRPDVYRERSTVQVDQTTRLSVDGDGSRARLLLAEWQQGGGLA